MWQFSGETLVNSNGVSIENGDGFSRLNVENVSAARSGTYTLTAANIVGQDTCYFNATVKGKRRLINSCKKV